MQYDTIKVGSDHDLNESIQVALANIPILSSQVIASYMGEPVLTRDRLKIFTKLLNEISAYRTPAKRKIDLIVFPEVSVPHAWEKMLVEWARKHHIGVICGLEHRINKSNEALNEVLAALPFKVSKNYWDCFPIRRLKRIYSPDEDFVLRNQGLQVPECNREAYQLIRWRGSSFAIYNCYELAHINERGMFLGKIDFLICTEFNKDVNYFSNIVESAARDLHCFVVQVNDSRFGDSRIVSPSKTEKMNPLRIKGGENVTFLSMNLDLKSLRDHQRKEYGLQKESEEFKPTPPGLDRKDVRKRIRLGKKSKK